MYDFIFSQNVKKNEIEVYKLNDSIYKFELSYGWGANILVSVGDDGVLLVDSGYRRTAEKIKQTLRKLTNKPIKCIINSHIHADHTGGNDFLGENSQIIIHEQGRIYVNQSFDIYSFTKEHTLMFNAEEIQLRAFTGGHSISDIIVFFNKSNILFFGDLYLSGSFPIIGKASETSVKVLVKHLKQIADEYPEDTTLISGHGKDTTMPEFRQYIAMVEESIQRVRAEINKKISLPEIIKKDVLHDMNKWSGTIWFINKESWIRDIYKSYVRCD